MGRNKVRFLEPKGHFPAIYKIINPIGQIYIGQTICLMARISSHKGVINRYKNKICSSFLMFGFENHIFQAIEVCKKEDLRERERFWQDYYDSCGDNGLNQMLTNTKDKKGAHSDLAKKRISETKKGHASKLRGRKVSAVTTAKHKESTQNAICYKRVILNTVTGIFYKTRAEAAESIGANRVTLTAKLLGKRHKNNTPFIVC